MKFKRFFLIFIIFTFFILILNTKSFATYEFESNTGYTSITHKVPDLNTVGEYYNLLKDNGFIIQNWDPNRYRILILADNDSFFYRGPDSSGGTPYIKVSGHYIAYNINTKYHNRWDSVTLEQGNDFNGYNFVYYSADIFSDINKSDYFFRNPPLKSNLVQAVEEVGVQEMKQATKEIVAILPVILSVLVSLLALLKGLKALLNFLRKS